MFMANFKTNAMRILDSGKINYNVYTYNADGDFDGQSVAKKIGIEPERVYKTLVTVAPSKNYYVFVVPVLNELDLKACARAVGEKSVEMIQVKDINKVTGYILWGILATWIIGMKKQYKTVIDDSCLMFDAIVFSAGKIGYQVEVSPDELVKLIGADVQKISR